jgi:hypothetical protein
MIVARFRSDLFCSQGGNGYTDPFPLVFQVMSTMFRKDPNHWLYKWSPQEWIQIGLSEFRQSEQAYARNNTRAGFAGARRAAGMALNGALIVEPNESWGRSFMDHLFALAKSKQVPEQVVQAAKLMVETPSPGTQLVSLRTKNDNQRILDATQTIMAHAYAVVVRHQPRSDSSNSPTEKGSGPERSSSPSESPSDDSPSESPSTAEHGNNISTKQQGS